jgi:hypothetical protein
MMPIILASVVAFYLMAVKGMTPCRIAKIIEHDRDCSADHYQYFK